MFNAATTSHQPARSHDTLRSGNRGFKEIHVDEEVKIAVTLSLERFSYSDETEMQFPSSLSSTERAFIHRMAQSLGYISKSQGKGWNRFLTIRKKDGLEKTKSTIPLIFSKNSLKSVHSLLLRFPITNKEQTDMQPKGNSSGGSKASGSLNSGIAMVPPRRSASELDSFCCSLPVRECQGEVLHSIKENRVVLVVGETGCGKTTQIPQFLLDECSRNGEPCRIICTQPRRLATIAVAERVAAERGECVGQTVGYHIRLESRVSPTTLLTFCTTGVLLRTLMAGDSSLKAVTHVIVDEVHERDGLTDFLLTKMRDVLQKVPKLKLILSSAALDVELFLQYFGNCPVVHLRGRQFDVQELFLEDILRLTDFNSKAMRKSKEETTGSSEKKSHVTKQSEATENNWVERNQSSSVSGPCSAAKCSSSEDRGTSTYNMLNDNISGPIEPWLQKEMDSCISNIFVDGDQDTFIQLFNLIFSENVNVDYKHSETGATPLMAAAARGFLTEMEQLFSMGANINIKAANGWTALTFAKHFQQTNAMDLLRSSIFLDESGLVQREGTELTTEDQELLKLYHHSFDDERVDLDLIMHLLCYILSTTDDGAVLIFLPGYDEIVALRDCILFNKQFSICSERYPLFTLHSSMLTQDQKKVMKSSPPGVRKIILSTNIAETSITINDVVFVIDSGKVKEKSFDTVSHASMLKCVWISKASALQRKGRAGRCRPGICFHLFSRLRFSNMLEFQVPQLLRMPLQELCLQTKLLAPSFSTVAEFLSRAPQPPHVHAIRKAVHMLKTIGAMNQCEELTDLGYQLADLPIEPHLGKMVLCAVVLKCLDPILTIACTLAYRDPFIIPVNSSEKRAALQGRHRFSCNSFSDHMALLRAFQAWQKAHTDGWGKSFCEKNCLSQCTMDMILGMRTHLLGQLRANGFVRARGGNDIRDVNINSENWAIVKAALVTGMYPNMVHINQKPPLLSCATEKVVNFHPTSVLSQIQFKENISARLEQVFPTDWLIYDEMSRGHRMASVRCCSLVTAVTVAIFGGCIKLNSRVLPEPPVPRQTDSSLDDMSDNETEDLSELKVDDWLVFKLDTQAAVLLLQLRQKWQNFFLKRIHCPSKPWSQEDETIIRTLVSVLTAEEQGAGLQQPTGIGQRPRPMSSEEEQHSSVKSLKSAPQLATHDRTPVASRLLHKKAHNREEPSVSRAELPNDSTYSFYSASPSDSPSPSFSAQWVPKPVTSKQSPSSIRYFIMKSSNMRNIEISQQKGIWSTTPTNEARLVKAYLESDLIILIFSVQGSGHFQGYAHMTSGISQEGYQDWGLMGLGGVFSVQWIHKESLSFLYTQHILNSWNDYKQVQISRDGQELDPQAGSDLLSLWKRDFSTT